MDGMAAGSKAITDWRADEGHATEAREPEAPCWNQALNTEIGSRQKNPQKGCGRADVFPQVPFHFRIHAGTQLFLNSAIYLVGKSRKSRKQNPPKKRTAKSSYQNFKWNHYFTSCQKFLLEMGAFPESWHLFYVQTSQFFPDTIAFAGSSYLPAYTLY